MVQREEEREGGSGKENKLLLCILGPASPVAAQPRAKQMWAVTQTNPAPHLLLASLPYPPGGLPHTSYTSHTSCPPWHPLTLPCWFSLSQQKGHSPSCPPSAPTLSSLRPIHSCGVGGQPRRGLEQVWGIG